MTNQLWCNDQWSLTEHKDSRKWIQAPSPRVIGDYSCFVSLWASAWPIIAAERSRGRDLLRKVGGTRFAIAALPENSRLQLIRHFLFPITANQNSLGEKKHPK